MWMVSVTSCTRRAARTRSDVDIVQHVGQAVCLTSLPSGLKDSALPEGQTILQIKARHNGFRTKGLDESRMTGKHLNTGAFTAW